MFYVFVLSLLQNEALASAHNLYVLSLVSIVCGIVFILSLQFLKPGRFHQGYLGNYV